MRYHISSKVRAAAEQGTASLQSLIPVAQPQPQPVVLTAEQQEFIKIAELERKSYEALWNNLLWAREILS